VNSTEQVLLMFRTMNEQRVEAYDAQVAAARERADATAAPPSRGIMNALREGMITPAGRQATVERLEARRAEVVETAQSVTKWHKRVLLLKTLLPKTQETVALTERALVDADELEAMFEEDSEPIQTSLEDEELGVRIDQDDVAREVEREKRSRSVAWIVGTSLLFEGFVLGIACWIFCRRDY